MDNPTNYFDRTYVINLPERTDRLREVSAALKRINMPLNPGKVEVFPAIRPQDSGGFASTGAHGCFLSHLAVLKKAHDFKLSKVLVLEDDVEFVNVFPRLWPSILTQLRSESWSFVYFGYFHIEGARLASRDTSVVQMRPFAGKLRRTHAYAVDGSILESFIQHLDRILQRRPGDPEGGPMHFDGALNDFRSKNPRMLTLIAEPRVAWQRASHSDLHSRGWKAMFAGRMLLKPARMVKNYLRRRRS